jgi:NAD(P)-dependent dehydrogenase (short-subunit alcohol dehydrogenase family)
MARLKGKVALITGAARGIGRATAVAMAREGADVALVDIASPKGVKNIHGYRLANRSELAEAASLVEKEKRNAIQTQMKKQKSGRMIVLASTIGRQGFSGVSNYVATKWGAIGLVKTLALELGQYNITVNAVSPTVVNTPLYRSEVGEEFNGVDSPQEQDAQTLLNHALPIPVLNPEDIADGILFLASNEAKYISGIALDIAAGSNARYTA